MREWINIVCENAEHIVSADEIVRLVQSVHHTPEDLSEGDLTDRIYKFRCYVLMPLPIGELDADQWHHHPDLVADYATRTTEAPPIVYDAVEDSIIDGTHRAKAAALRGQTEIMAYVGLAQNLDPDWSQADDDGEDY